MQVAEDVKAFCKFTRIAHGPESTSLGLREAWPPPDAAGTTDLPFDGIAPFVQASCNDFAGQTLCDLPGRHFLSPDGDLDWQQRMPKTHV